jgi:tetratricopeptide (TPR) repeat protein
MGAPPLPPESEPLLTAWRAWHASPDDEDLQAAYRSAVAGYRVGPVLRPGEIVADRYQLHEQLGDGPLTARFAATDLVDDEPVLLEVLHARYLHMPGVADRFHHAALQQQETERHGVVPVRHAGDVWEGFHWMATDRPGQALSAARAGLSEAARRQVLLDVGEALQEAHEAELAHGALDPEQVLLDERGAASLTGFGMRSPIYTGSLFAAPETADPTAEPTAAADRYSYAMLVAWMELDGELPYWALRDPVKLLESLDLGEAVHTALGSSWALDPAERPEGVADLVRCLRGDAEQVRQLAELAVGSERWQAALGHYRQLLGLTRGDPDVRADLAICLARAGKEEQALDQLYACLRAPGLRDEGRVVAELRTLVEPTGDVTALVDALEQRADLPGVRADLLFLEAARLRDAHGGDSAGSWARAFEHHRTRDQALEALRHLTRRAADEGDWVAFVQWGRQLAEHEPEAPARARMAFRVGEAFQQQLRNPNGALHWLQRALDEGYEDPDLHAMLESLQSERGDWSELLELLQRRAEESDDADERRTAKRRAARVARRAGRDPELAALLFRELLDEGHDNEAALFLAARARREGDLAEERALLERLDPTAHDDLPAHQRIEAALRLATLLRQADELGAATDQVKRVLDERPDHVGGLSLRAALLRDHGQHQEAIEVLDRLASTAPAGSDAWVKALLARSEQLWRYGEIVQSYLLAEDVARLRPTHGPAHWAMARAAMVPSPLREELGTDLSRVPFTPQEALARLLDLLVDVDALHAYADTDPLGPPLVRSSLATAASAVDRLCAHDAVDEVLFGKLTELRPDQSDAIRLVERLWEPSGQQTTFPIGLTYSWQRVPMGDDEVRRPVAAGPQPSPLWQGALGESGLDTLMVASSREVASDIDPDAVPIAADSFSSGATLAIVVHPGDVRQLVLALTALNDATLGGGDDDTVRLEGLPEARARITRAGDHHYLHGGEGLTMNGLELSEVRLRPGLTFQVDGVPVKVVSESEAEELAGDDLTDFLDEVEDSDIVEEEDAPTFFELLPDEAPMALTFVDGEQEFLIPLVDEVTDLPGDATLAKEEDGWRLTQGPVSRFVVPGEAFELEDLSYTVVRIESVAPPTLSAPTDALVPSLIMDDGSLLGRVITLTEPKTTIGRGRSADIKIRNDAKVSRKHATLELRDGKVVVVDHGSSNGTFVDEDQVEGEAELSTGQKLQVGDTMFEFRLRADDKEDDEDLASTTLQGNTLVAAAHARLSVDDGKARLEVANRALQAMLHAVDSQDGPGAGRAELQLLLDVAPRRFRPIFEGVDVKRTGLPVMRVLYNVATCSEASQRATLVGGLTDLIERSAQRFADLVEEERACEDMLEAVARTNYRKHLRL